ncbi:hypothetical protein GGH19_000209 [Coemansia sp. RSA 1807]|nr:hypothetical protein GGH19_000209 [Coemansia sp. RSA 1807]
MSLLHLDAVAFATPADQVSMQQNNVSPVFNAITPTCSQSPFAAIKSEPNMSDCVTSMANWPQPASVLTKLSSDSHFNGGYDMSSQFSHSASAPAYPTPDQNIPQKVSAIGNPLGSGYESANLMLNTAALGTHQHSSELATGFAVPMHGGLPGTTSLSEFATAATTPNADHNSAGSSPLSSQQNMLSHTHMSPVSMMSGQVLHSLGDIPSISAGMMGPISRPMEMLAGHSMLDSSMSLSHQLPSTILHSTGMGSADIAENGLSSAESSGYGICEDITKDHIAYWDSNNFVCIPVMENLRAELNLKGMTANHTDSLQKNFNDYQFKRQTDQRRIRHTTEQGIVKFSNENFLPGRRDLLDLVVRKSALKKLQNGGSRERPSGTAQARKKPRVPSMRQNGSRTSRQSTSERLKPYGRPMPIEAGPMVSFPMSVSPTTSFQTHHMHNPPNIPQYYGNEGPSMVMQPLGVANLGFSIAHSMPLSDRPEPGLIPASNGSYSQQPFYMNNASPGLMPSFMHPPPHVNLPTSFHGQYPTPLPPPQHHTTHTLAPLYPQQQHEYQENSPHNGLEDHYHGSHQLPLHPPHMQQPHQYQVFATPGDMHSHHTPPRGVDSSSHPA